MASSSDTPSVITTTTHDLLFLGTSRGPPSEKSDMTSAGSTQNMSLSDMKVPTRIAPETASSEAPSIQEGLSTVCLNLPPAFFSINMGTGITSILLYNFPYPAEWLRIIGTIIFVLNIVIFSLLALGNIMRYSLYKGLFRATVTHVVSGMFWGTLPMGFATIVNMVAYVCVPRWGQSWAYVALGLWWIDAVISVAVNLGVIFFMFTQQKHTPETMTAMWLLPIVSSVVAAASGGVVATCLMPFDPILARSTVIVSYVIWGTGVPLACFVMALWLYRTTLFGIPPAGALPSVFLPLGPCGQGSFGIILLGRAVRELAYSHTLGITISPSVSIDSSSIYRVADAVYAGGLVSGLVLWGLGLCWYILAFAIIIVHVTKQRDFFHHSKFSVGLWALTFPLGVFATATTILASELDSLAFRVIGAFLSVQVTLHWIYVSIMTVYKVYNRSLFVAPEIAQFVGLPPRRFRKLDIEGEQV